jgi:hypothetical protein
VVAARASGPGGRWWPRSAAGGAGPEQPGACPLRRLWPAPDRPWGPRAVGTASSVAEGRRPHGCGGVGDRWPTAFVGGRRSRVARAERGLPSEGAVRGRTAPPAAPGGAADAGGAPRCASGRPQRRGRPLGGRRGAFRPAHRPTDGASRRGALGVLGPGGGDHLGGDGRRRRPRNAAGPRRSPVGALLRGAGAQSRGSCGRPPSEGRPEAVSSRSASAAARPCSS